jgi:hypothetical protein
MIKNPNRPETIRRTLGIALGTLILASIWIYIDSKNIPSTRASPPTIPSTSSPAVPQQGDPESSLAKGPLNDRSPIPTESARYQKGEMSEAIRRLATNLAPTLGVLSPEDRERARGYIQKLRQVSDLDLENFSKAANGTEDLSILAKQAEYMLTAALWQDVEHCLDHEQYWLIADFPSWLPKAPPGSHYQMLTVFHEGKQANAIFIITDKGSPTGFIAATRYHQDMRLRQLQEAAFAFNSRPHEDRAQLFQRYKSNLGTRGHSGLDDELKKIFPEGSTVDSRTLLMYAPK